MNIKILTSVLFSIFLSVATVSAESTEPSLLAATAQGETYLSGTFGFSNDSDLGHIYAWEFAAERYFFDQVSFSVGGILGYADPRRMPESVYGGFQLGVRWHFFMKERWSLDLEGLAAAVAHEKALTEESLRFNFDLQPGLGLTYLLNENTMLRTGARWHHLSNARVKGKKHNLGYDGPMGYIQIVKSF